MGAVVSAVGESIVWRGRKPGTLAKIEEQGIDAWINSLGPTDDFDKAADEFLYPGRKAIRLMVDDELAEVIAKKPGSKLAKLAESELRIREAWRGPARWSLVIAALAFVVSLAAFIRAGYS